MSKRRAILTRVSENGIAYLEALAAQHDVSRAEIIRLAIIFSARQPVEFDRYIEETRHA